MINYGAGQLKTYYFRLLFLIKIDSNGGFIENVYKMNLVFLSRMLTNIIQK